MTRGRRGRGRKGAGAGRLISRGLFDFARPGCYKNRAMASNTRETWKRRVRRHANMGKKRKAKDRKHSTPSAAELFAGMGEPTK